MSAIPSKHGAADSAVGYQYQAWYAFLLLLRSHNDRPDAAISLELHDDVAWEDSGSPIELLGLKHHGKPRPLTDTSDDMWRSLRVWKDSGADKDPDGPMLLLITTSGAPPESAAAHLRNDDDRSVGIAIPLLINAARTSHNLQTEDVRTWFDQMSEADREIFVNKIVVVDNAATIDDVDVAVRSELWWALPKGHEDLFLAQLWRWWEQVALDMLKRRRRSVSRREAQATISDFRNQFGPDSLPTLVDIADVDDEELVARLGDELFVWQMRWVEYPLANIRRAIVDYYRAVQHTTRWLAEDLIGIAELARFEDNLRDEWARAFDDMVDDLGPHATDAVKVEAGKRLLRHLLDSTAIVVRQRYAEPFLARGKRHEIADLGTHGWHPEFADRVKAVLDAAS